jgi:hypothetical protein
MECDHRFTFNNLPNMQIMNFKNPFDIFHFFNEFFLIEIIRRSIEEQLQNLRGRLKRKTQGNNNKNQRNNRIKEYPVTLKVNNTRNQNNPS